MSPRAPSKLSILTILFTLTALLAGCARPDGAELFKREGCVVCHRIGSEAREHSPGLVNLNGVTRRRSEAWIRDQLKNSRLHRPDTGMPSFAHLKEAEVEALIDYLKKAGSEG